ncbi:mycoredoxin [Actinocrinis puniceicyclus]|uniref:Mycoredoxin n=1 Tax=Actinocrinis puniceicyclus TaxID=977794 RepID=A0A8J8BCI3_9ACTN|nr:mycoredoxin [Actinocrinis puniceicyclus]MBS2963550.1 mycoredoxin [Actinocrinis puniceicyclus]
MSETEPAVTLYTRPGCPYCSRLRRGLNASHLRYREIDIWQDPQAAAFVRSVAGGNETVPTVVVAGHAMVNPSAARVRAAVSEHAPGQLPAQTKRRFPWLRAR